MTATIMAIAAGSAGKRYPRVAATGGSVFANAAIITRSPSAGRADLEPLALTIVCGFSNSPKDDHDELHYRSGRRQSAPRQPQSEARHRRRKARTVDGQPEAIIHAKDGLLDGSVNVTDQSKRGLLRWQ